MLYIATIEAITMDGLDRIKTTITLSLGTKNRLRKLKGSQTYEEFINYMIRTRVDPKESFDNMIEIQRFKRKKAIYSKDSYKVLFSYNQYSPSRSFMFDISLDTVRKDGKKATFREFLKDISNKDIHETEYMTYFELLQKAIQEEIEPLFKHNGRIEDYFSWEQEFNILNLPKRSFDEDVMEKLQNISQGLGVFE